jgi:hypothetical protein
MSLVNPVTVTDSIHQPSGTLAATDLCGSHRLAGDRFRLDYRLRNRQCGHAVQPHPKFRAMVPPSERSFIRYHGRLSGRSDLALNVNYYKAVFRPRPWRPYCYYCCFKIETELINQAFSFFEEVILTPRSLSENADEVLAFPFSFHGITPKRPTASLKQAIQTICYGIMATNNVIWSCDVSSFQIKPN